MSDSKRPPRPVRAAPPSPARGAPPAAGDTRPTPVRDAVRETSDESREVAFPGQSFTWKDQTWWAQELGRTRAGRRQDTTPSLVLVGFRPAESEEPYLLEALVGAEELAHLSEPQLRGLAERAVPFRGLRDDPPPFFGAQDRRESKGKAPRSARSRDRDGRGRGRRR